MTEWPTTYKIIIGLRVTISRPVELSEPANKYYKDTYLISLKGWDKKNNII